MTVSYWQKNEKIEGNFDIIIIGGGISGLSTAYWLTKDDPTLKVALVEQHEVGFGATGRNAGFVTCGSVEHFNRLVEKHGEIGAKEIWNFSEVNKNLLEEEIIQENFDSFDYQQGGSFSLASSNEEFLELKKSAQLMKSQGISVEMLIESEVSKRLGTKGFVGGIKYLDDATIHPMKLLAGLQKKLKDKISLFEHCEVYKLSKDNDQHLVETKRGDLRSNAIVLATNGYSALIDKYFEDKVYPTRGQILVTERAPTFMEGPCYANFVLDYFRQLKSGHFLIGGFRQLQKDTEIGYSDQTSPMIQDALEEFIKTHLPILVDKKIVHRWSGIMGFSFDGMPLVGSLPKDPTLFFVGGHTAHGLGLAFHCGKSLSDVIFGRPIPEFISMKRL